MIVILIIQAATPRGSHPQGWETMSRRRRRRRSAVTSRVRRVDVAPTLAPTYLPTYTTQSTLRIGTYLSVNS